MALRVRQSQGTSERTDVHPKRQ